MPWGIQEAAALYGTAMVLTGRKAYEQGPAREFDSRQFHQYAADVPPWHPIARLNPNRPPFEARYNKVGLMVNHVPGKADKPDLLRIREVVYLAWLMPMKALVQIQHPQPQASLRASAAKTTGTASGKTLSFIKKTMRWFLECNQIKFAERTHFT